MADLTLAEIDQDIVDTRVAIREVLTSQALIGPNGQVQWANLDSLCRHLAELRRERRILAGTGGLAINVGTMRRD